MLNRETNGWNRKANQKRTKINWRFTRKKARKVFKYKPRHCKAEKRQPARPASNKASQVRQERVWVSRASKTLNAEIQVHGQAT